MKIKALITLILTLALCIPFMSLATTATEGEKPSEYSSELIYAEFQNDKIEEKTFASDNDWKALASYSSSNPNINWSIWETPELFMLDCKLTTYYRNANENIPTGAIFYVVGHGAERIGTENDLSIVEDFLANGYVVIVTEFINSAAAVSPAIDGAMSILKFELVSNGQFVGDFYHGDLKYDTFIIPAGYRMERNVVFFDLLKSAAKGTIEAIVGSWNDADTKAKVEAVGITWTKATTLDDIIMPNGKPINDVESGNYDKFLTYKMDIIYPSLPNSGIEVPVVTVSTGSTVRAQGSNARPDRMVDIGALFRGYATVLYDHEYMPQMNGRDSYGHIEGATFGLSGYTGAKFHSAAMRCIRAYAEKLGTNGQLAYSTENIGVMGHSKSSMVGLLSNPNPQLLSEHTIYDGYYQGETYGEQPFLTYEDGTAIPSGASCVYHSMGYGSITRAKYLTPANVPTLIACGVQDNANPAPRDYWEQEFKDYSEAGIPFGGIYMPNVGHTYPYYVADPIYGYVYYDAMCAFFDYNLKGAAPQIMYTGIEVDGGINASDKGLFIYFSAPITEWSLLKSVSVTDANGNKLEGEWIADCGGMMWTFVSNKLIKSKQYTLTVSASAADINGNSLAKAYEKDFTVK